MSAAAFPVLVPSAIGGALVQTVNARDLHAFLRVGRDFTNWIKGRIAKYGFIEDADFVTVEGLRSPDRRSSRGVGSIDTPDSVYRGENLSSPDLASSSSHGGARPQRTVEYHLTMDMAKELSMVENNAQGRAARRYFIECEWRAKEAEAARVTRSDSYAELPIADNCIQMVAERRRIYGRRAAGRLWLKLGMPGADDAPCLPGPRVTLVGDDRDRWCERIIEALASAPDALDDRKLMIRAAVSSGEFSMVIRRLETESLIESFAIRGQRFYRSV